MAKERSSEQVMNVGEIEFRVPKLNQCDGKEIKCPDVSLVLCLLVF